MKKNILYIVIALLIVAVGIQGWYILQLKNKSHPSAPSYRSPVTRLTTGIRPSHQSLYAPDADSRDSWDPFEEMDEMQKMMNRLFHDSLNRGMHSKTGIGSYVASYNPEIDLQENEKEYLVRVDLPGIDKDKIHLKVQNGYLIISGERTAESQRTNNAGGTYYYSERSFGSFTRSMPLPSDADTANLKAESSNGVLTVHIPKLQNAANSAQNIVIQ